jgi:hypothetical protein
MEGCDNAHARNACQIMADYSRRREMLFMTWWLEDAMIPFMGGLPCHCPI